MIITHVTKEDLEKALAEINQAYDQNIKWNRIEPLNRKGTRWAVTLRCVTSKGPGHRVSSSMVPFGRSPRRLAAACWHVHGHFFDCLPRQARVYARGHRTYVDGCWEDFNIGSIMYPQMASTGCDC